MHDAKLFLITCVLLNYREGDSSSIITGDLTFSAGDPVKVELIPEMINSIATER